MPDRDEWEIECPRCAQVLAECSCPREDEDDGEGVDYGEDEVADCDFSEPADRFGEKGEHMSAWRYYDVALDD